MSDTLVRTLTVDGKRYRLMRLSYGRGLVVKGPGLLVGYHLPGGDEDPGPALAGMVREAVAGQKEGKQDFQRWLKENNVLAPKEDHP